MTGQPCPRIIPTAEDAVLVEFSQQIDPNNTALISAWCSHIRQRLKFCLTDVVPSYGSVTVYYNPDLVDFRFFIHELQYISNHQPEPASSARRVIELPVWYHPTVGPDLQAMAAARNLTPEQIADLHSQTSYQVYALGFSPGFAFMGLVDSAIATPRLKRPRLRVAAGSVGIADQQTAVYPSVSPGGWQLIGRCSTPLFNEETLSLLQVGDTIRFRAVDHKEFVALGGDDTPFDEAVASP